MTVRRARPAALFLLVALVYASALEADPVRVTSGQFRLNANDTPVFEFRGDGFALPGVTFDQPNPIPDGFCRLRTA